MSLVRFIPELNRRLPNEIWDFIKDYTINNTKYIINNKLKFPTIFWHSPSLKYSVITSNMSLHFHFTKIVYNNKITFTFTNEGNTSIKYELI